MGQIRILEVEIEAFIDLFEKAQKKDKELGTGKKFEREARLKRYGENLKKNLGLNNIQIPPPNDRDQTEGIISTP